MAGIDDEDDEFYRGSLEGAPEPRDDEKREAVQEQRKVGYGNPPIEYQWPKGQSGNPSGQRKKHKKPKVSSPATLLAAIVDEFAEPVRTSTGSKMQTEKALAKALKHDVLGKDPNVRRGALRELRQMGITDALQAVREREIERERARDVEWTEKDDALIRQIEADMEVMRQAFEHERRFAQAVVSGEIDDELRAMAERYLAANASMYRDNVQRQGFGWP